MSFETPPRKRRIKRVYRHPNLLFEKWLQEWRDEAEAKGSQMKYNYARAIKSLKSFPLPLYRGADCKVLSGFGDKICQQIDRKMQKHIEQNGPIDWEQYHQVVDHSGPRKKRAKKQPSSYANSIDPDDPDDPDDPQVVNRPAPRKRPAKKKTTPRAVSIDPDDPEGSNISLNTSRKRGSRPYVPAVRSGAYAILMAFHQAAADEGFPDHLKRGELMESAQEFCDASFTQAPDGSHYTAWSSMATLLRKHLITKEGSPARYTLTVAGEELCERLVSAEEGGNRQVDISQQLECQGTSQDYICEDLEEQGLRKKKKPGNSKKVNKSSINQKSESVNTEMNKELTLLSSNGCPTENTHNDWSGIAFSYIDERGIETPMKDRAVVNVDDGFFGFLIKCRLTHILNSDLNYVLDDSRNAPIGFTYAYLEDTQSPNIAPGVHSPTKLAVAQKGNKKTLPQTKKQSPIITPGLHSPTKTAFSLKENEKTLPQIDSISVNAYPKMNDTKRKTSESTSKTKKSASAKTSNVNHSTDDNPLEIPQSMVSGFSSIPELTPELSPYSLSRHVSAQASSQNSTGSTKSVSSTPVQPQFSLSAGTYEILLCVDNAEVVGGYANGKKNQKDIIITELRKHGVTFDVRKLHVGDFLWVAREKQLTYGSAEPLSKPRELVLPYVIERKRMDDLASSIKDGRFREQKFRLKQSGLSRPMYLVEQYGSQNSGLPESTCEQAVVNTQVVDGFLVKWTKDQRESAAFLTIMTRSLQSIYQGKTLDGISKAQTSQDIDEASDFPSASLHESAETSLQIFNEFNSASMKTRQLCVREMFAKQLLQLNGLSVDKAKAITDMYPTPSALISAYNNLYTQIEREQLLSALKSGKLGKPVGQTISANIARLYTSIKIL